MAGVEKNGEMKIFFRDWAWIKISNLFCSYWMISNDYLGLETGIDAIFQYVIFYEFFSTGWECESWLLHDKSNFIRSTCFCLLSFWLFPLLFSSSNEIVLHCSRILLGCRCLAICTVPGCPRWEIISCLCWFIYSLEMNILVSYTNIFNLACRWAVAKPVTVYFRSALPNCLQYLRDQMVYWCSRSEHCDGLESPVKGCRHLKGGNAAPSHAFTHDLQSLRDISTVLKDSWHMMSVESESKMNKITIYLLSVRWSIYGEKV